MPPTLGLQSIQKSLDLQRMIGARLQKTHDETSGVSLWQCLDCGHSSRSKSDCSKHVEAKHIVTSGYDCSFCGSHYPSKNALKSHVSRKHRSWLANRDNNLSSDTLELIGDREGWIKSRMILTADLNGERIWSCTECNFSHKKTTNVSDHIEVNHLVLRVPCRLCPLTFSTSSYLKKHIKHKHAGETL